MIIIKTTDINPFVRYANHNLPILNKHVIARDCRLFYIKEDGGTITINNVTFPLHAKMLLLFQCGTQYMFSNNSPISIISINFDYTSNDCEHTAPYTIFYVSDKNEYKSIIKPLIFEDTKILNEPIIINDAFFLLHTIEKILKEKISIIPYSNLYVSALMKECIIKILRFMNTPNKNSITNQKIEKVLRYLEENYANNINNADIAKLVAYHPYYLNKIFLATIGKTLHQYIIELRLTAAENLLIAGNLSVAEIAETVGFASPTLFITNFKKRNNMTPAQFRKELQKFS